jgi:HAD superfamily hydrolase (TIGR01484 family)
VGHRSTLQKLSVASLSHIRLVATDMDGTLTENGKFSPQLLQAFADLAVAGVQVLIITGRSAGWMGGIAHLMPVLGTIAENGGLFYQSHQEQPIILTPIPDLIAHRQNLSFAFTALKSKFPQIQESADNRFRLTDWTFDVADLTVNELQIMADVCQDMGWGFTYSNVQCHIKPPGQDKAVGLLQVLRKYLPQFSPAQVLTVGDSPNDESLFNQNHFAVSVGVANVLKYVEHLQHHPTYITQAGEGQGFCELSRYILSTRVSS